MSHTFEVEYADGRTETVNHVAGELPREGEFVVHEDDEFRVERVVHTVQGNWAGDAMKNTDAVVHLSEV